MLEVGCGYPVVPFSSSSSTATALLVLVGGQIPMETTSGKARVVFVRFERAAPKKSFSCLSNT